MTVNLNKVKRTLNDIHRAEDKTLAALQRYLEKDNKPARQIKFETSLSIGGKSIPISTEDVTLNASGQVLRQNFKNNHPTHQHNISWDNIDKSYKVQEAIHQMLAFEYEKEGKIYGGRRLYSTYDKNNVKTKDALKIIESTGSRLLYGKGDEFGYLGKYKANDIAIHQRVLEKIYGQLYKETDKHLLDKFETIELDGEFSKLIKGTKELIYDIKKVKNWSKEVERLVKSAELKYKAQVKELQRQQAKAVQNQYLLSIDELEQIGRAILGLAIEKCPIETGFLRSSGKLYVSDNDIRIIFEAPYAAYVHDCVNNKIGEKIHHTIGEDHFLEKAAQEILPTISVWAETTGDDAFVLGDYMAQTWAHDEKTGHAVGDMYWKEQKGYTAIYIDIDRNLRVNYAHYR